MQNRRDRLDYDTEQLLLTKSYDQLTTKEIDSLEGKFSEATYNAARKTLQHSRKMFVRDTPVPDPQIRIRLQKIVAHQRSKTVSDSWWTQLLSYRIPMWQPIAGLSLLVIYMISPWATPLMQPDHEATVVYKTDTIYRDKPVFVKATMPASSSVYARKTNYTADNEDTTERNFVLDTLQGVVRDIRSFLPVPAATYLFTPATELSDTATMTNDTASISTLIGEIFQMDRGVSRVFPAIDFRNLILNIKPVKSKYLRFATQPLAMEERSFLS